MNCTMRIALAACLVCLAFGTSANAATLPLTGWSLATNPSNYTGGPGTTLTPSGDNTSVTLTNTEDGFTTGTGFFATFDSYALGSTLGVGETIRVSFDLDIDGTGSYSNNAFRVGLYNHNGSAATDAEGWLGYMVHAAADSGSQGDFMSRNIDNSQPYASGSGLDALDKITAVDPTGALGDGSYAVQMDLTLVSATEVDMAVSIIGQDNTYEWVSQLVSPDAFVAGQTTFDRLGFQLTGAGGAVTNSLTLSNVTVSVVPEPSSVVLALGALGGLALVVQRKRSALRVA